MDSSSILKCGTNNDLVADESSPNLIETSRNRLIPLSHLSITVLKHVKKVTKHLVLDLRA
jgi:hypothetical protein